MSERLVHVLETSQFHVDGMITRLAFVLPGGVVPSDSNIVFLEIGDGAWDLSEAISYAYATIDQFECCMVNLIKLDTSEAFQRDVFWPAFRRVGTSRIKPLNPPAGYSVAMSPEEKLRIIEAFFAKLALYFRTAHHPDMSDVEPPVLALDRSEDCEISGLPSD